MFGARTSSGEIYRVVRVLALHMVDPNGDICVEMLDNHGKHRLPGRKMEGNETIGEATQQLLDGDLSELAEYIRCEDETQVVEEYRHSAKYNMPTKYIKTIQKAVFDAEMEFAAPVVPSTVPHQQQSSHRLLTDGIMGMSSANLAAWRGMGGDATSSRQAASPAKPVWDQAFALDCPKIGSQHPSLQTRITDFDLLDTKGYNMDSLKVFQWISPE
eukprot:6171406-Amphidinium_carterae.1